MHRFTSLILKLGDLHAKPETVAELEAYFRNAPPEDSAWALWLLLGNKLKPAMSKNAMKQWITELTGYPDWLIQESNRHVGNLAETFSLLAVDTETTGIEISLNSLIKDNLVPLKDWDSYFQKQMLEKLRSGMSKDQFQILLQLLTGSLRTYCSRFQVVRSLANALGVEFPVLLHRLQQDWQPSKAFMDSLTDTAAIEQARRDCPYPIRESGSLRANLVLVYAYVSGLGENAGFSAYALGAVKGDEVISVARMPSGLEPEEMQEVDQWIQDNTLMKKGPVRTTPAKLVFQVAFDGVYLSRRHKCGLVLDNPVIVAWEKGAPLEKVTAFKQLESHANPQAPLT